MKIATWNVNGIRPRKAQVLDLLNDEDLDVLCLQETKIADEIFPRQDFIDAGYWHQHIVGQKAHHGVAILSRVPFAETNRQVFANLDDKRHAEVRLENGLSVNCVYVPSGGDKPDTTINPKFDHKMRFLSEMQDLAAKTKDQATLWVGDLNVAYRENDTWDHKKNRRLVGHSDGERAAMEAVIAAGGFTDLPRQAAGDEARLFTWWGYRYKLSVEKDYGWHLDHVFASQSAAPMVKDCQVLKYTRLQESPSDHIPIVVEI